MEGSFKRKNVLIGGAAEFLGVSVDTIRRWDEKGILTSTRPDGKNRYFSIEELEKVKYSQPLTISEAAQRLEISEATLRRLEDKGLITPDRDHDNNRIYTLKCLEKFIESDYFLRRQEIEDKILSAPETTETKNSDYQKDVQSLNEQHRVLSAELQRHNSYLHKLNRFRKSFYAGLVIAGVSLLFLTTIFTLLFIAYPERTGRWFGLYSTTAVAQTATESQKDIGKVLGASYIEPNTTNGTILGKILQPIGGLSLEITRQISPNSYNRVVGDQAIKDVNDVLGIDSKNNITSKYNLTFPDSSYLIIPDTNLIKNLNADYIRGKIPGTNPGDLAYYNKDGKITGVESDTELEANNTPAPLIYDPVAKSLSLSYSSNNLKTENGQLTTIQGISTTSSPFFAGITIGGINGLLVANNGTVSSITNNSANWDSAYSHVSSTTNPHNVTANQVLPNQTGQNGKVLGTNGSTVNWITNSMGVAWGAITGSLSDQSDLNITLGGKESTVTAGLNSQYYRGDKTWQTLNKSAVGLGNVENTALSTWAGTANVTTLGTIIAGTWNGTAIDDGYISSATNWNTAFSHSSLTNNPHSVTQTQVGLSNVVNSDTTTTANITDSLNKRFVSDANLLVIGNTSGNNTGDKTLAELGGVAVTTTVNGHALSANVTVTATDLGLGSVENTALSTWAGSANITTLGTVATGTWNATAIGDSKISSSGNWNTAYGWGNHAVAGYFIKASDDLDDVAAGITNVHLTATLKSNYDTAYSHTSLTNNPHSVTATQVGLGSVDNISDVNKSVLSATKLTTARAINGVDFDGTAPITIYDSTKVSTSTTVNSKALSGNITLDTSDIADTANKRYVTDANLVVIGNTSGTNTGDNAINSQYSGLTTSKADVGQTMYIGTTAVAINRTTGALALTGVSIDGSAGSVSGLTITAGASISGSNTGDQTLVGLGGVPTTTTVNGHALSANVTVTATDLGLGSVENTALSTWAGTNNITTLGTIATGTWNATAIGDGKIATALTGKTYNALTLTAVANGFTIAGGDTSKTLTVPLDASVSGTNTGDQDISSINKFKIDAGDTTTGYFEDKINFGSSISVLDGNSGGSLSKIIDAIQDIRTSASPTFSGLALGAGNLTMTGSLGATGTRLTKGWFTDLQVTNAISGSVTGNAGTVTGLSVASGKTLTASNTLTLTATDGSTLAIGGGGTLGTNAYTSTAYLPLSGGTMAGAIAMGGQAITGAGAITGTALTGTSFAIGANTLDTTEWAFLDGQNQAVKTTSNTQFNSAKFNSGDIVVNPLILSFDGNADYVTLGTAAQITELSSAPNFSISTWANFTDLSKINFFFSEIVDANHSIQCYYENTLDRLYFLVGDGSNSYGFVPSAASKIPINSWHHIVVTYDGTQSDNATKLLVYIDGVAQTLSFSGAIPAATADLSTSLTRISSTSSTNAMEGNLKRFSIYSSTLSQGVVTSLYQGTNITTNRVHHYKLDEQSGSVATDTGTNPIDGTITGTSWRNSGNVGIGTDFPTTKLSFEIDTTKEGGISWGNDTNLYRSAADTLKTDDAFQALSYNGLTVSSTTGTLTIAAGKTLTVSNTLTLTSTDGASLAIGGGGTLGTGAYATINDYATVGQTFYIGTTQVAINRASAALTLAGLTLTAPDIGAAIGTSLALTQPANASALTLTANSLTDAVALNVITPESTAVTNGKVFAGSVTGESLARMMLYTDALGFGGGAATRDVFVRRSAINEITIDSDKAGGTADLALTRNLKIAGDIIDTGGTSASLKISGTTTTRYLNILSATTGAYLRGYGSTSNGLFLGAGAADHLSIAADGSVSVANTFAVAGHTTLEGVTSTGAAGTGKFVFDTSPTFSSPTISGGEVTLSTDTNFVTSGGTNGFSIDGTTFSVDGANDRIGIGTSSPSSTLSAWGGASGGGFELMRFNAGSINGSYIILGHPYNSTIGNYGYLPVDNEEGKILAQSYNGTSMSTSAGIFFKSDQQHESGKIGTRIEFATTPNDSIATPTVRFVINNAGHITLEGVTSTGATGTGKFVFDTSPVFITPNIGIATATSIAIGANTLTTAEWAFLDGQDQATKTTDNPYWPNMISQAKGATIEAFKQLTTDPANIKGLWMFDQTGAVATVTDRSESAHTMDLSANGSTLTPGVSGLARYLTIAGPTSFYDTVDHADFSVATDKFTIVWAGILTDATGSTFLSKADITTASKQVEWMFRSYSADKLVGAVYNNNTTTAYISRTYNTAITGDQNQFHVYAMTYSGGTTDAAIKLYRDGVQVDDTNFGSGTFTAAANTTSKPASYYTDATGAKAEVMKGKPSALSFIKGEEWTASQIKRISTQLLGWGNNLP